MGEPVEIVDYDPAWPEAARAEAALIGPALAALAVEHVGSTAMPGLAAKPILDLLVGVADLDSVEGRVPAMEDLGYEYRGPNGIQERRYFVKGRPRTHHVHVTLHGSEWWLQHVTFRDRLRAHPAEADAYEALKRELATRYRDDRLGYTEAKTEFIEAALARALESR